MYVGFQIAFRDGEKPIYCFGDPQKMIWSITPRQNGLWNLTYILKKNTFFTKMHTFFPRVIKNPITLIMTYIFFWGPSKSNLRHSLTPKWTLELQDILRKNKYILSMGNLNPNNPYYDLCIPLETLKKWFEMLP